MEGKNHELKESETLHEDTHDTTIMQEVEVAAAANEKEEPAAAEAQKEPQQRGQKAEMSRVESEEMSWKQTHHQAKGQHKKGFEERRKRHEGKHRT